MWSLLVTSSSITFECRPNSPIPILQSLYCTVLTWTQAPPSPQLGFVTSYLSSLLSSLITVSLSLQITHEVFFAPPNSFLCHYSATLNSEDSTQFNSSAPKLISWLAVVSKLDSTQLFFITTLHGPNRKQPLYCWEGVFIATEVTWLLPTYSLSRGCVYRVVA
jgi:hypothetical protein